jgi:hypothetical protein
MITTTPPATWESGQIVNPERLNENRMAANDALGRYASNKWTRFTVSSNIPAISPSGTDTWVFPNISNTAYIIERVTVYGSVAGTDATLSWGDFSDTIAGSVTLSEGTPDGYGPSRATAFPGYTMLEQVTDWNETFTFTLTANTSLLTNIHLEVGIRVPRADSISTNSTPPVAGLYRAGNQPNALSFNTAVTELQDFADDWTDGYATYPFEFHYVEFAGFNSLDTTNTSRSALPGADASTETVVRILAYTKMSSAGAVGQDVTIGGSFSDPASAPTTIGTFSVAGVTTKTYSSGPLFIRKTGRSALSSNSWFTVQATTDDTVSVERIGIWIVKHKI